MGPRAGLDRCVKFRLPPGFDPRTILSFLHPQNTKSVMFLSHILLTAVREYVQGTVQMLIFHVYVRLEDI